MIKTLKAMAGALVAAGLSASTAGATAFDRIVVLGDSLSDSGNAGRFSNGPVWVEQLGSRLGLEVRPSEAGGSNFAIGGARLDPNSGPTSLRAQLERHLKNPRGSGRVLHIVFGGGNDLLAAVQDPAGERRVDQAAASLKSIVFDLVEHGATDILVPNLPDIGVTPAVAAYGAAARDRARRLTDRFNAEADRILAEAASEPDLRIHRLDVHAMAERARDDPAAFGFVDVTTPCFSRASCEGHLFWDQVHPTARAHARLAEAAAEALGER